jgi:microcystin-dependent protein
MWPGGTLPAVESYGNWVWADGSVYAVSLYPLAYAHISSQWRTFGGASDPGVLNFRVPDLRGLVPAGMDQMPGGARANRITRSVSIVIAGKSGEEIHTITIPEMPAHGHSESGGGHTHNINVESQYGAGSTPTNITPVSLGTGNTQAVARTSGPSAPIAVGNTGGGAAHENMQPTVFVPYIVKMDD